MDPRELFVVEDVTPEVEALAGSLVGDLARMRAALACGEPPAIRPGRHCRRPYDVPLLAILRVRRPGVPGLAAAGSRSRSPRETGRRRHRGHRAHPGGLRGPLTPALPSPRLRPHRPSLLRPRRGRGAQRPGIPRTFSRLRVLRPRGPHLPRNATVPADPVPVLRPHPGSRRHRDGTRNTCTHPAAIPVRPLPWHCSTRSGRPVPSRPIRSSSTRPSSDWPSICRIPGRAPGSPVDPAGRPASHRPAERLPLRLSAAPSPSRTCFPHWCRGSRTTILEIAEGTVASFSYQSIGRRSAAAGGGAGHPGSAALVLRPRHSGHARALHPAEGP